MVALFRNTSSLVLGVDYRDGLLVQALTRSEKVSAAEEVVRAIQQLMTEDDKLLKEKYRTEPPKGDKLIAQRLANELLEHSRVDRQGTAVRWHSEVKMGFGDVITALVSGELGL